MSSRSRRSTARSTSVTGEVSSHSGHAVVLCTGGYGNAFYLSTNAVNSNATAIWRAHKRGALFSNPCYTQIHPTAVPHMGDYQSKLTLMSESLRNDGRIWVPDDPGETRPAGEIPEDERDYYLERKYPSFGNLAPRDISSRAAKEACDDGRGVGGGNAVYLDFRDSIQRLGKDTIEARYGNLFDMYQRITDENPYTVPMRIFPAPHYTMGGLWVDYNLQSTIEGLFVAGEANFSDHGANRLGASALMQGLADGYFVLPYTIQNFLAGEINTSRFKTDSPEFDAAEAEVSDQLQRLMEVKGNYSVDTLHKRLGKIMWDYVGMARNEEGLKIAREETGAVAASLWFIFEYRRYVESPQTRNRLLWVFIGILLGYAGGSTNFLLWYNIPVPPYLNIFSSA